MDVLALNHPRSQSVPAEPREPVLRAMRRRLLQLLPIRAIRSAAGGPDGAAISRRRAGLLAYTGAVIVFGIGLLAVISLTSAPWPTIDAGFAEGTVLSGSTGGLLLWLLFGILGSLRVLQAPGGASLTFHLPFVGAALILGGPTAGAWVAFLSTLERRELETQPWYGILANHSILVIGAVAGGLVVQVSGILMPGDAGGPSTLVAAAAGAIVLATVTTALGAFTVLLREGLTRRELTEIVVGRVGRITAMECALVVVLALAYVQLGWWAPLLVAGFVLVIWDNDPMPPLDWTGLPGREGFRRLLEAGVGRMRRGVTTSATVLFVDLDRFKWINDNVSFDVGNEVLTEVAVRLRAHARRADDIAGRLGGDEFAMFLPGLDDSDVAVRRADEIYADLCRSIASSKGAMTIGASIGVVVVHAWGGVPSGVALLAQAAEAMHHAKAAGGGTHLYDPDEPPVQLGDRRAQDALNAR